MSDGGGDRIEGNPPPRMTRRAQEGRAGWPMVETKMEDDGSRKRGLGTFGA